MREETEYEFEVWASKVEMAAETAEEADLLGKTLKEAAEKHDYACWKKDFDTGKWWFYKQAAFPIRKKDD